MISVDVRVPHPPRIVAVFSFRHDVHLVPDLLANLSPLVDGWVSYDDRGSEEVFSNEVRRRTALLGAARSAGASWVLAADPDERYESSLADHIRGLTEGANHNACSFALREMFTAHDYRVDGVWGRKRQTRLLRVDQGLTSPEGNLHLSWSSFIPNPKIRNTDFNLYHLKMITPERRRARAALYSYLDPDRRMQKIGYDYLADDCGAELERITEGRGYAPDHREDGGLWMPAVPAGAE